MYTKGVSTFHNLVRFKFLAYYTSVRAQRSCVGTPGSLLAYLNVNINILNIMVSQGQC